MGTRGSPAEPWGYMPYQCGAWNYYNSFGWGWAPGVCQPWWGGGGGWAINIGNALPALSLPRASAAAAQSPARWNPAPGGCNLWSTADCRRSPRRCASRPTLPVDDCRQCRSAPPADCSRPGSLQHSAPVYGVRSGPEGPRSLPSARPANSFEGGTQRPGVTPVRPGGTYIRASAQTGWGLHARLSAPQQPEHSQLHAPGGSSACSHGPAASVRSAPPPPPRKSSLGRGGGGGAPHPAGGPHRYSPGPRTARVPSSGQSVSFTRARSRRKALRARSRFICRRPFLRRTGSSIRLPVAPMGNASARACAWTEAAPKPHESRPSRIRPRADC